MKDELIKLETAVLAKEKGFNGICIDAFMFRGQSIRTTRLRDWNSDDKEIYSAPTQSLLARWLREKHNIYLESALTFNRSYGFIGYKGANPQSSFVTDDGSYEEALEYGLVEALNLIKTEKK